jgi:hypothetical protein
MRYRLMASYLGASYQAAVGPTDRDVTLFAAPPPPEAHGFAPVPGGIWRKQVRVDELDALWESRPIGSYHGEPCLVLDDLGDRLHVVYLGMDERRAGQLGYWQVDRGVFEVVVARHEVTDLAEERHEFPIALLLSALPRALSAGGMGAGGPGAGSAAGVGAGRGGAERMALASGGPINDGPGTGGPGNGGPGNGGYGNAGPVNGGPVNGGPVNGGPVNGGPVNGGPVNGGPVNGGPVNGGYGNGAPGMSGQLPGGGIEAWNGQQMTGSYQMPAPGPPQPYANGPQLSLGAGQSVPAPQQHMSPNGMRQLPAAGMQQPAGGAGQQPVTGSYQMPGGMQQALPQAPGGMPSMPSAVPAAQGPQGPQGPQLTGAPQLAAGGQLGGAQPSGQPMHGSGQVAIPQIPGSGQVPMSAAQMPGGTQPPAQQQAFAAQPGPTQHQAFGAQPGPTQPGQAQPGQAQPGQAQPGPTQQYPVAAQPPAAQPQQAPSAQQLPDAQPAAAVAAWHGSPAPDGNGTWYYQPADIDPQHGGLGQNGTVANGINGYAQPGPGAAQGGQLNAPVGGQQQAQPTQGVGYQQAPPVQQAPPQQQVAPAQPTPVQQQAFGAQPVPTPQYPEYQAAAQLPVAQPLAQPVPPVQFPPTAFAGPALPPPLSSPPVTMPLSSADLITTGPLPPAPPAPPAEQPDQADQAASAGPAAGGTLSKLTGAVRGRRAARKPRLAMSTIFADLVDLAHIPRSAYAVDDEVTGAMCLFKTDGGYEVFSCAEDARHEVRFFEDEEAAYFYLFGVLAAEALRNGRLSPRRG